MRRAAWLLVGLVGCDLGDKIPLNLAPILLESDPAEGEELAYDKGVVAVYIVVTDEDTETLIDEWFLLDEDGNETALEGEPFTPSLERTDDNYVVYAQSFSLLAGDGTGLRAVVTDDEGATLSVDWPLAASD